MVWYPIQFSYLCLWETLWAGSFLSILEATASNIRPSTPPQLTHPFGPSHLSFCPVLPSGWLGDQTLPGNFRNHRALHSIGPFQRA